MRLSISRTLAAATLCFLLVLGLAPTATTPDILEPEPASANFQPGCALAVGSWFFPWARAGSFLSSRAFSSGVAATTTVWGCRTNPPNRPNGNCVAWNGPRGRCSLYANGCARFGTPSQRALCR